MDTKKVRLGSISILMSVILLCVTVLAVLSLTSARADDVMAQRFADQTSAYYDLQNEGQRYLAKADEEIKRSGFDGAISALSADGAYLDLDGNIVREIENETMKLTIILSSGADGYKVEVYRTGILWEEDLTLDLLP